MPPRLSETEVAQRLQKKHIELLDPYVPERPSTRLHCTKCDHTWSLVWGALRSVTSGANGCPRCAPNFRRDESTIRARLLEHRILLLDHLHRSTRAQSHPHQQFRCITCDHEWESTSLYMILHQGVGCPQCAGSTPLAQAEAERRYRDRGLALRSAYRGNKTRVDTECLRCHHRWQTVPGDIFRDRGCPVCSARKKRVPKADVSRLLAARQVSLVDGYRGVKYPATVRCATCDHEWKAVPREVLRGCCGCPSCNSGRLKSENEVRQLIEEITGWPFPKLTPKWLRGWGRRAMELDGYNEEHQVAFEYQGEQHYQSHYGAESFARTKRNDNRKRCLCRYHGVLLIRIPYWKHDIEGFVRQRLRRAGKLP